MNSKLAKKHPCYGCDYSCMGTGSVIFCEYIFITGKRRPCPGGKGCTVKKKKSRANARDLTINGKTLPVTEWAEITGISKNTIYSWYTKFGREYTEEKVLEIWKVRKDDD